MNVKDDLNRLFQVRYDQDSWLIELRRLFPGIELFSRSQVIDNKETEEFLYLGNVTTEDGNRLGIYEIKVNANTQLARNRVQLRQMVAQEISANALGGALAVYYGDNNEKWRFSYIAIEHRILKTGKVESVETPVKRFTYVLGEGAKIRTAVDRFAELSPIPSSKDLQKAFAVETLNKEFYIKLDSWYQRAKQEVVFPNDEHLDELYHTATSLIRLLTRLLFVWFIKEKKLVNPDLFKNEELHQLIYWDKPSSYYKAILQNLFFATLNREITDRSFRTSSRGNNYLVTNVYRYQSFFRDADKNNIISHFSKTPFLNGGLFECLDREADEEEITQFEQDSHIRNERKAIRMDGFSDRKDNAVNIPNSLFFNNDKTGLIDLLGQYQFTVEESAPLDIEVALDPELMGLIFENLLADYNPETSENARKNSGSFYTPREIVSYMVDESLMAYLATEVPPEDGDLDLYRDRLKDMFIASSKTSSLEKEDGTELIYEEEKPKLINAISKIKILDPAVGSGAFPMGILQRLVALLRILDPNNELWMQQQLNNLPELQSIALDFQIAESISNQRAREKAQEELNIREQEITKTFAEQDHFYTRKLYLIENCIFGVDIQPIAIQIAKLRFFISLVIEQDAKDDAENYGIRALPNLETRFVVANSLLSIKKTMKYQNFALSDLAIQAKKQELNSVRQYYFNAKTLQTKRKYRQQDKALREDIAELLVKDTWDDHTAQKIALWNPYDPNAKTDWFDSEWMFGITDGFDVVIGNPPYIQLQNNSGELGNFYQNEGFATFARSGDIYYLFYEKGINLLKQSSGYACFISSNQWMRVASGKALRKFIENQNPVKLVNLGAGVFDNVTVNTNVLLINRSSRKADLKASDLRLAIHQFPPTEWTQINPAKGKDWVILHNKAQLIKDRMEAKGTQLKEWDISINYGIKTGYNNAFIINNETKDALIAEDPKSAEILKPVLRGRDIKRYQASWAKLWVISTFPSLHLDIENYPAIKRHLLSYGKERLEQTGSLLSDGNKSRKKTPHAWFELQDTCAYHEDFAKEKIAWGNLSKIAKYSYARGGMFVSAPTTILTPFSHYLLSILNSDLIDWYFRLIGVERDGGFYEYKPMFIERLPIPLIPDSQKQPFTHLVDQILASKAAEPLADTSDLEAEIENLVYQIYGLTEEEIAAVKGVHPA